jgi:tetratricopeptide (TPR) repeat protein
MPRAKSAALTALELDPTAPDAHLWLAAPMMLYDWDWEGAEAQLRIATSSGFNSIAEVWYSLLLGLVGRHRESIPRILRAQALDPISLRVHQAVGRCYTWAGQYENALAQLRAALQMEPSHPTTHVWISRALLGKGAFKEALAVATKAIEIAGSLPMFLEMAGVAYVELGMNAEACAILAELRGLANQRYVSPAYEASVLGALGELDEAFRLYDAAAEQRSSYLTTLRGAVQVRNSIRADSRFTALLKRLRLDL